MEICGSLLTLLNTIQIRLKKEQEEKEDKRRYKAQAHLYAIIKVAASHSFSCLAIYILQVLGLLTRLNRIIRYFSIHEIKTLCSLICESNVLIGC